VHRMNERIVEHSGEVGTGLFWLEYEAFWISGEYAYWDLVLFNYNPLLS
jgi:hypothetical protein